MDRPDSRWTMTVPSGATFPSCQLALDAVHEHAHWQGYTMAIKSSTKGRKYYLVCSRSYSGESSVSEDNRKHSKRSAGTGCLFAITVSAILDSDEANIKVTYVVHNHEPWMVLGDHARHRRLTEDQRDSIALQIGFGISTAQILTQLQRPDSIFRRYDILNAVKKERLELRLGKKPIAGLLQWLPQHGFEFRTRNGPNNELTGLFITTWQCIRLAQTWSKVMVMDSTYKTNKYLMPLFHIVGYDANYKTFTIAYCFLASETSEDYKWALSKLRNFIAPHYPAIVVTDRELALIKAYREIFPQSRGLLCIWHINMNILARCRKKFDTNDAWKAFNRMVQKVIYARSEEAYDEALTHLQETYSEGSQLEAFQYCKNRWFELYGDMFCLAYTGDLMTFNTRVTSRVEGAHAGLKTFLHSTAVSLNDVCIQMKQLLRIQHSELKFHLSSCYSRTPTWLRAVQYHPLFHQLASKVSVYALEKVYFEHRKALESIARNADRPEMPCFCDFMLDWGMPCRHIFYCIITDVGPVRPLTVELFDSHWHLPSYERFFPLWGITPNSGAPDPSAQTTTTPSRNGPEIVEPSVRVNNRIRSIQTRQLSAFEHTEASIGESGTYRREHALTRRREGNARRRMHEERRQELLEQQEHIETSEERARAAVSDGIRHNISIMARVYKENNVSEDAIEYAINQSTLLALASPLTPIPTIISAFTTFVSDFEALEQGD